MSVFRAHALPAALCGAIGASVSVGDLVRMERLKPVSGARLSALCEAVRRRWRVPVGAYRSAAARTIVRDAVDAAAASGTPHPNAARFAVAAAVGDAVSASRLAPALSGDTRFTRVTLMLAPAIDAHVRAATRSPTAFATAPGSFGHALHAPVAPHAELRIAELAGGDVRVSIVVWCCASEPPQLLDVERLQRALLLPFGSDAPPLAGGDRVDTSIAWCVPRADAAHLIATVALLWGDRVVMRSHPVTQAPAIVGALRALLDTGADAGAANCFVGSV
jgi:hypothetical protein